jgi:membrane-associated protease RseP (regulator of RpoE activity)
VVELSVMRGGKSLTIKAKLGDRETEHKFGWLPFGEGEHGFHMEGPPWEWHSTGSGDKVPFAGIVTQSLTEGLAQYFKVEKGALVSEVVKDSPADKAGVKPGDVIVKVGDEKIEDESDVRDAVRKHKIGDEVDLLLKRDGQDVTIKVKLGERDSSKDTGSRIMQFGDENDGSGGMVVVPDQEDFDHLGAELKELKIDLKDLPDVQWDSIKQEINIPQIKIEVEKLKTIAADKDFQKNLQELKDQIRQQKGELKKEMQRIKIQAREIRNRVTSV